MLQAAVLGVWIRYGFTAFFLAGLAVQAMAFLVLLALAGESPVAGYGRRHRGRYATASMLEPLAAGPDDPDAAEPGRPQGQAGAVGRHRGRHGTSPAAVLWITIPDTHRRLWPDVDTLVRSLKIVPRR
ncbi:hypothetical protein [Nonomuraea sp. JJY05]|uniref:hypothetical protein n=1 Tax=Nonomuraea sp. JJY05 TaxID=3350255 RepID=UPI00373F0E9E